MIQCSGQPAPCERCLKLNSFCHFDEKLDTRRKSAWTASEILERQQYILHAVLHALRCNDDKELYELLKVLRRNDSPQELAQCLLQQIESLQERQIIAKTDIDIHDVLSLAVEGLSQGQGGRKSHGLGTLSAPGASSMPDGLSEMDSEQQTDGQMSDGYPQSTPRCDTNLAPGAVEPGHNLVEKLEVMSQFSFDPPPMFHQPSFYHQPTRPFTYGTPTLSPVGSDAASSVGFGSTSVSSDMPQATYSAGGPSMSGLSRLAAAQHFHTLPTNPMLDGHMTSAGGVSGAPGYNTGAWATSPQLLDGFSRPWLQEPENQPGRRHPTVDGEGMVGVPRRKR